MKQLLGQTTTPQSKNTNKDNQGSLVVQQTHRKAPF